MCVLVERAVQRDDVTDRKRLVEPDIGDAQIDQALVDHRVERDDLTTQVPQQSGHDRSDLAGTDHRGGLSGHVETDEAVEREVALTHPVVRPMDLAVEREHQRQRVFGDGVRRVRRHPHDREPEALRRLEIDVVEAGTPQRDARRPGASQHLEHAGGQVVVDESAHDVGAGRIAGGPTVQARLVIQDLHSGAIVVRTVVRTVGRVERAAVVGLGREHRHRRHAEILAPQAHRRNHRARRRVFTDTKPCRNSASLRSAHGIPHDHHHGRSSPDEAHATQGDTDEAHATAPDPHQADAFLIQHAPRPAVGSSVREDRTHDPRRDR